MESQQAVAPSKADIRKSLEGLSDKELRAAAARLHKSHEHLRAYHEESLQEQQELKEEAIKLNETIDLMAKECQKLNISSTNCVEPELEEGPLNFIGRFWDKMKPRTNQVLLNEHVGELKKLPQETLVDGKPIELPNPFIEQIAGPAVAGQITHTWRSSSDTFNEKMEGLSESLSDLKAQTAEMTEKVGSLEDLKAHAAGLTEKVQTHASGLAEKVGSFEDFKAHAAGMSEKIGSFEDLKAQAQAKAADLREQASTFDLQAQAAELKEKSDGYFASLTERVGGISALWGGVSSDNLDQEEEVYESDEEGSAEQKMLRDRAEMEAVARGQSASHSVVLKIAEDVVTPEADAASTASAKHTPAPEPPAKIPDEDEGISSTVLIEAHLKLDDENLQVLRLRAVDRCKEVAAKFIQEHALKAIFTAPLTAYLKKVESDAEKFPVRVEADLMDILNEFSHSAAAAGTFE